MDIQTKREEIEELIDSIKEHSDRLKQSKNLPLLELSVILSKITQLHEKTLILKYLAAVDQGHEAEEFGSVTLPKEKAKEVEAAPKETKVEEKDHPVAAEQLEEIEHSDKKDTEESKESTFKKEPIKENESPNHQDSTKEKKPAAEHLEEISEEPNEKEMTIEEMEAKQELETKPDLNEAFTEEEDPSLSGQLRKQPIQDLLTAIGLNERYLYANELFEGNIEDFREAIKNLNDFESGEDAKSYFDNELRKKHGWEKESQMARALYLLVERRYN